MTEGGKTCKANGWTQGNDPATSSGATGSVADVVIEVGQAGTWGFTNRFISDLGR